MPNLNAEGWLDWLRARRVRRPESTAAVPCILLPSSLGKGDYRRIFEMLRQVAAFQESDGRAVGPGVVAFHALVLGWPRSPLADRALREQAQARRCSRQRVYLDAIATAMLLAWGAGRKGQRVRLGRSWVHVPGRPGRPVVFAPMGEPGVWWRWFRKELARECVAILTGESRPKHSGLLSEDLYAPPAADLFELESESKLLDALGPSLTPEQRVLLELLEAGGAAAQIVRGRLPRGALTEVAGALHITPGAARVRWHRLRKRIRAVGV